MPEEDCKLVKLLKERDALLDSIVATEMRAWVAFKLKSVKSFKALMLRLVRLEKQIAFEEILHHEKVQAESEIERDRIKLEAMKARAK